MFHAKYANYLQRTPIVGRLGLNEVSPELIICIIVYLSPIIVYYFILLVNLNNVDSQAEAAKVGGQGGHRPPLGF